MNKDNEENEETSEDVVDQQRQHALAEDQQFDGVDEESEDEESEEGEQVTLQQLLEMVAAKTEEAENEDDLNSMRSVGLYGDVEEERIAEVISALLMLQHVGKPKYDEEGELTEEGKPIRLYVSTYGGSADDMAALVDIMNVVKKDCPIETVGIGKVMSAGVLILASGTKGERYIGKNCRVMIHSVIAGNHGSLHNLENELSEIKKMQDIYLQSLADATNMTKKQLKSFMRRKQNVYLNAEEAINLGIADKILE
jgi:ATP-dependent Clp protease, protease subunit